MSYFRTCPACGSNLDPNERCDCQADRRPGREEVATAHALRSLNQTATLRNPRSSGNIVPIATRQQFTKSAMPKAQVRRQRPAD